MEEFDDITRLLREERPQASELELDQIKQRVRRRTASRPSRRSEAMKSRLAILSMLVLGILFSTTGAGLAVQSLTQDDASVSQYDVQGEETEGDVLGEEDESGDVVSEEADDEVVQPSRQVEVGSNGELPFTGFLAIPVLIGGVALLTTGLVLRRRTNRSDEA